MRNSRNSFAVLLTMSVLSASSFAAEFDLAASATNSLGVDLYHQLAKGQGNLCLSPYSISCALAMTLTGADGETRTEMSRVLHLNAKGDDEKSFASLQHALEESAKQGSITFAIANRLFPQSGYELRPEFVARAQDFFGAPPESLDFRANGAAATKHINDWVAQQTHDRIQNLIPSPLDAATRLVLANALYLKAPWEKDFSEDATKPEPFHVNGGAAVDVPTMNGTKIIGYKKFTGHTALALPYIGGEFQFLILLPNETKGVGALEKSLTSTSVAECAKLESAEINLHLPKFKFEPPTIALAENLRSLGMKTAFDVPAGRANFDRMAPRKPNDYLAISEVFHKTFIAVDEKGTEAAAATAVAMMSMSAAVRPSEPIEVKVDRPFIYAIQHVPSGACLFLGRVMDPR